MSCLSLASKSDRGRFDCRCCQQIGRPIHVSAGRFAGSTDSQTGLCPIHVSKQPLNRPGRFARRPDTRFGRLANRSEHMYCTYILANTSRKAKAPSKPSFEILNQFTFVYLFAWINQISFVPDVFCHL